MLLFLKIVFINNLFFYHLNDYSRIFGHPVCMHSLARSVSAGMAASVDDVCAQGSPSLSRPEVCPLIFQFPETISRVEMEMMASALDDMEPRKASLSRREQRFLMSANNPFHWKISSLEVLSEMRRSS